jgi:hypothetical protein
VRVPKFVSLGVVFGSGLGVFDASDSDDRLFLSLLGVCLRSGCFGLFLVAQVRGVLVFEAVYVELEFFMLADLVV